MAKMLGDGKVGDKEFLDKERRNGKVYLNLDEIEAGKYLLEIYIKLSVNPINHELIMVVYGFSPKYKGLKVNSELI